MAEKQDDNIKVNIYAEKPGDTVKPSIVTVSTPAHDEEELEEKAEQETAKERKQDAIKEAAQNDKSGEAG